MRWCCGSRGLSRRRCPGRSSRRHESSSRRTPPTRSIVSFRFLLQRYPDLVGFYVAGGGMEGDISALREENMAGRLAVVCNEITPDSRAALAQNIVTMMIATPLERLSRELVAQMVHAIQSGGAERPGQVFMPFDIYVSENIWAARLHDYRE